MEAKTLDRETKCLYLNRVPEVGMKRYLSLFVVLSLAGAVRAQDGSFENRFPPLNPPTINQKVITPRTDAKEKPKKKQEQGKNEMPSMPQPGGGGGGDDAAGGGKGGGGGCKSCSGNMDAAKKAVEQDLAAANPKDGKTQSLINSARDSVQNADTAKTGLDKATLGDLTKAKGELDSAAGQIGTQNSQNKASIGKLKTNQTSRDSVVKGADVGSLETPPSCTGNASASPVSDSGTGAVDKAKSSVKQGQSLKDTAAQTIQKMSPYVQMIGSVVAPFTTAAASSLANLGGGISTSDAMKNLTNLKTTSEKYQTEAEAASAAAEEAVKAAQEAQDASLKTAKHVTQATKQDEKTTKAVKDGCDAIGKDAKRAWDDANKLTDEALKNAGKQAAIAQATTTKQSMTEAQTAMGKELQTLDTEQQDAESKLDAAKSAIKKLGTKLTGA